MMRRHRLLVAILIVALGVGAARYLSGGRLIYARYPAPDHRGSVELITPARWQAWQVRDYEIPVAARYVEPNGTIVGPTMPFDLVGNAELRWDSDGVSIGTVAVFDRRNRRWSVES